MSGSERRQGLGDRDMLVWEEGLWSGAVECGFMLGLSF